MRHRVPIVVREGRFELPRPFGHRILRLLAPRTGSGAPETNTATVLAEDFATTGNYAPDTEYVILGRSLRPFAWLGAEFEAT